MKASAPKKPIKKKATKAKKAKKSRSRSRSTSVKKKRKVAKKAKKIKKTKKKRLTKLKKKKLPILKKKSSKKCSLFDDSESSMGGPIFDDDSSEFSPLKMKRVESCDEKVSLVFKSEGLVSNKFWNMKRNGTKTLATWGRLGSKPTKQEKDHGTAEKAQKFMKKIAG